MLYNIYETEAKDLVPSERDIASYARANRYDKVDGLDSTIVPVLGGRASADLPMVSHPVVTSSHALVDLRAYTYEESIAGRKAYKLRSRSNAPFYIEMANQLVLARAGKSTIPTTEIIKFNTELIVSRLKATLSLNDLDSESLRYAALASQLLIQFSDTDKGKLIFMFKNATPFCELSNGEILKLFNVEPNINGMLKAVTDNFDVSDRLHKCTIEVVKSTIFKALPMMGVDAYIGLYLPAVQAVVMAYADSSPFGRKSVYGLLLTTVKKRNLVDTVAISKSLGV